MENVEKSKSDILKQDLIVMAKYFEQHKIELLTYKEEDIPELFEEVILLLENISEIFYYIKYIEYIISGLLSKKDELTSKLNITFEDINSNLKQNFYDIIRLNLSVIMIPMFFNSYNPESYLKFITNTITVSTLGFTINYVYLLSNLRKRIILEKINKIDKEMSLCESDIELFKEAYEQFRAMLELSTNRLNELTPSINDDENYEEYFKRIYGNKYDILMLSYVNSQSKQYIRKREKNERYNNRFHN